MQPKNIITVIINMCSVLFVGYLLYQLVYFKPKSGQSIRWSLQRKLRFGAVFFCLLTKLSDCTSYSLYALYYRQSILCESAVCLIPILNIISGICIVVCFLCNSLVNLNRYGSMFIIAPGTREYKHLQLAVAYLIIISLLAIVSNILLIKSSVLQLSMGLIWVLFVTIFIWIMSAILCDLIVNNSIISLTLQPVPPENACMPPSDTNVTHVPLQEGPRSAASKRQLKVLEFQNSVRKRLRLYYAALVLMDMTMLLLYGIGNFTIDFSYEANVLTTSWVPIHIFINFQLLNITYATLKQCKEFTFTTLDQTSGFTPSEDVISPDSRIHSKTQFPTSQWQNNAQSLFTQYDFIDE